MSEEFSDDFELEEEEEASNRPFLIVAGSLIGIFILISACVLAFLLVRRTQNAQAVAGIEAANATTEAENALVTQTVAALQTEAARPTNTPTFTPTPEATETPTATPSPTDTPVVQQPTEEPSATLAGDGTVVAGGGDLLITPTLIPGAAGGTDTLPATGLSVWGIAALAVGLLAILILARRLRTG